MGLLIIIGIIWIIYDVIKEARKPTIPAENWNHAFDNWDIYDLDAKEFYKNLKNGKYR